MKKTLLTQLPDMPYEISAFIYGANIYDSSCSPEARVYFVDTGKGYYIKSAPTGMLKTEAEMTAYFHDKGLGAEVLQYVSAGEHDWLMTSAVSGEDCTSFEYLSDPKRLTDTIATKLRELHELDFSDCPIKNKNESYLALAKENYEKSQFDLSYLSSEIKNPTKDVAYSILTEEKDALKCEVLLHGDYCLPNIMLDGWDFSGFVDLGGAGVGDRHIDLFWGAWTLNFNLKTDKYRERFFDAYGRDKVDAEIIKIISAAEVFG